LFGKCRSAWRGVTTADAATWETVDSLPVKLVRSEPFLDYLYEFDNYYQRAEKIYISARFSLLGPKLLQWNFNEILNNCGGISFKSHSYLYEVARKTFSVDF